MPTLTNSRNDLEQAIAQGIDFLYARQLPSGAFRMFRSPHPLLEENCEPDQSPFPAALISYCLSFTQSEKVEEILRRAIRFLAGEMEDGGVWRYWSRTLGYVPPDLDDTACISFLLRRHGISLPDNTGVMLGNRDSHGLFYTWVLPRLKWTTHMSYWRIALREVVKLRQLYYLCKLNDCKPNDLDAVVNANVLHYLGERSETRPIIQYLIHVIEEQAEETCDRWYGSRFSFYYFLSRNHAAGIRAFEPVGDTIVERIKSYAHPDGVIGSHILHTALAACALMDWQDWKDQSTVLDDAIQAILRARGPNGGWQKFPIYYSGATKKLAWGSDDVTTGVCLEALSRYRNLQS
ncbi:MAG: hypothetical protein LAP21_25400 [Acidobacteriia bacterium]|nr:hypothetical protein [Terriglobia bacterium]